MSEKYSLKWHDYQSNWIQSLTELRNDKESADITLISEDKVKFPAHKIVLSSCSKTFKFILKDSFQANSFLYLSGVSSVNLGYILDFMYQGEVNLFQEQLDHFLECSQKLEIDGMLGDNKDQSPKMEYDDQKHAYHEQNIEEIDENNRLAKIYSNNPVKTRNYNASSNNQVDKLDAGSLSAEEIEIKKEELYSKIDGSWNCLSCAYTTTKHQAMRRHVETHMEGLCYTCKLCDKEYRTSNSFHKHRYTVHK